MGKNGEVLSKIFKRKGVRNMHSKKKVIGKPAIWHEVIGLPEDFDVHANCSRCSVSEILGALRKIMKKVSFSRKDIACITIRVLRLQYKREG